MTTPEEPSNGIEHEEPEQPSGADEIADAFAGLWPDIIRRNLGSTIIEIELPQQDNGNEESPDATQP